MIDGITIKLSGVDYVVPSLTFKQVRELTANGTIAKVPANGFTCVAADPKTGEMMFPDALPSALTVLHAALSRNYPDLTRENLEEILDLAAVDSAISAVMGMSGLKRRSGEGEATSP